MITTDSKGNQKILDLDLIEHQLREAVKEVMRLTTKSSPDQDFQAFTTFDLTEKIESHILELVK